MRKIGVKAVLTTYETIDADHMNKFGGGAVLLQRLFFDYAVQFLKHVTLSSFYLDCSYFNLFEIFKCNLIESVIMRCSKYFVDKLVFNQDILAKTTNILFSPFFVFLFPYCNIFSNFCCCLSSICF